MRRVPTGPAIWYRQIYTPPTGSAWPPTKPSPCSEERVESRLAQVTPEFRAGLEELHGMGEARQVAEDLIEDIRAAQEGTIPWCGRPGHVADRRSRHRQDDVGRAIAKDCGVKFVVASAASWQSAGALDSHLRAMRADFAEAERYAPAIMFIDEMDSIGSRDHLEGSNAVYQTDVINALLEEIQGIEAAENVIVIGATNYLEKVDRALRRAGRLDQVVEIPLPNIDSLQRIFEHYLAEYQAERGLSPMWTAGRSPGWPSGSPVQTSSSWSTGRLRRDAGVQDERCVRPILSPR